MWLLLWGLQLGAGDLADTKTPVWECHRASLRFSTLFNVAAIGGKSPRTRLSSAG